MSFDLEIINWYSSHKRDLPWRKTKDPYFIWLSEIILQQTRIEQGLEYYHKFARNFPNIKTLADASEEDVLKLWQGLGYYTRARNLHATAIYVSKELNGVFPKEFSEIIKLKGIGRYTASAIASFAFDQCQPVLDGNVYRIITRFFGIETPIDSKKGENEIYKILEELIKNNNPALFNQAIMEFGALQCKPHNPECQNCPLIINCIAFRKKMVNHLPLKEKKVKQTNRFFNYLIIKTQTGILLNKRLENDIWKNLFEFPLIETNEIENMDVFFKKLLLQDDFQNSEIKIEHISKLFVHKLSHQKIQARFIHLHFDEKWIINQNRFFIAQQATIEKYAFPKLIENYLPFAL